MTAFERLYQLQDRWIEEQRRARTYAQEHAYRLSKGAANASVEMQDGKLGEVQAYQVATTTAATETMAIFAENLERAASAERYIAGASNQEWAKRSFDRQISELVRQVKRSEISTPPHPPT